MVMDRTMTLAALYQVDGRPVFLGDVLVSGIPLADGQVSLPVAKNINAILPETQKLKVAGLAQKINLFNDRLVVAFAGDGNQARDIAEVLSILAKLDSLD